jgi:exosortase
MRPDRRRRRRIVGRREPIPEASGTRGRSAVKRQPPPVVSAARPSVLRARETSPAQGVVPLRITGVGRDLPGRGWRSASGRAAAGDKGLLTELKEQILSFVEELREGDQRGPWLNIVILMALLVYSYWPGLLNAKASWNDPQYSHGWFVPLFSVILLFAWRRPIEPVSVSARIAGLAFLVGSFAVRLCAARYRIVTIDMYTFVPATAGVFLLSGGWSMFRWAWAPIGFMIFMYPLPDEATRYLLGPLQRIATIVSAYALQTMGIDAVREGNQIVLGELHLGVVDACSGLRMLTIFIALSVALVLVGRRDWWENIAIIASAVPIALAVNSIRITVTALLYQVSSSEIADMVFHDLAGWVMMPMALSMLFMEQKLLNHLVTLENLAPAVVRSRSASAMPLQAARPHPFRLFRLRSGRPVPPAGGRFLGLARKNELQ